MKNILPALLIVLLSLPACVLGQIIKIQVSEDGVKTVTFGGGKPLGRTTLTEIPITSGTGLIFDFNGIKNKNTTVSLVNAIAGSANIDISLPFDSISQNKSLSTDENFLLTRGNKKVNLKVPFRLQVVVVGDSDKDLYWDFNPTLPLRATPAATPGGAGGNLVNSTPNTPEEKPYQPGSPVYDALHLADNEHLSALEYDQIIKFYFPDIAIADTKSVLTDAPFFRLVKIIKPLKGANPSINIQGDAGSIFSSLSLSSIGGLDVTNIADGIAKFLVKRTKQELSIAFFDQFKKALDKYPDIKTLFPKTYNLLAAVGQEVYDYQKYIQQLRDAFKADILAITDHLPGIIDNHPVFFDKEHQHSLAAMLVTSCYIIGSLEKKAHPGDILANFPLSALKNESLNWKGSIQSLQLLSMSLRDTASADSNYWVPIRYIRQLVSNKRAFELYMGIVYQVAVNKYQGIPFTGKSVKDLLDDFEKNVDAYYDDYSIYISGFATRTNTLNQLIRAYQRPVSDSLAVEQYKKYLDASVDLLRFASKVGELPYLDKESAFIDGLGKQLSRYLDVVQLTADLATDINRKNYSAAINDAIFLYDTIWHHPVMRLAAASKLPAQEKVTMKGKAIPDADKGDDVKDPGTDLIPKANDNLAKNGPAPDKKPEMVELTDPKDPKPVTGIADSVTDAQGSLDGLAKYGGFMAAVSTAKTSDEVEQAVEAFALPSGSSRVKRESPFSITLNAYTGLFVGHETLKGIHAPNTFNAYGVTAPIGVALNLGKRHFLDFYNSGGNWSYSLFLSIIDLGAVAAYRFNDDTTASAPTIQLKNIISPGAFLSIGIPHCPLSVNLGAQVGPNLRAIDKNQTTLASTDNGNKVYWRYSIGVCVDIPLLNLYVRSSK